MLLSVQGQHERTVKNSIPWEHHTSHFVVIKSKRAQLTNNKLFQQLTESVHYVFHNVYQKVAEPLRGILLAL